MKHIVPSLGKQCGIASFASKIKLGESISDIDNIDYDRDVVLFEHEYGLFNANNLNMLANKFAAGSTCIQHAYSSKQNNQIILDNFDHVIYLTSKAKEQAKADGLKHTDKIRCLIHYCEELRHEPKLPDSDAIKIGIHGFGFPRNGFMKVLNSPNLDPLKHRVHILSSISQFNKTAEWETSDYIDRIRRKVWDLNDEAGDEFITLDCNYYDTKEEIIDNLRTNCDVLLHVQDGDDGYINASGSVNVLLATGLPVYTVDSFRTEMIPADTLNRIKSVDDFFAGNYDTTSTIDGIVKYHRENSVEKFREKVLYIMGQ